MNTRYTSLCLMMAAATTVVLAAPATAQQATQYDFDVAAGPLGHVVRAIVTQAGGKVSFADIPAERLKVDGVHGRYTLVQALNAALAGSGYRVLSAGSGEIRIARDEGNQSEIVVTAPRTPFKKTDSMLLTRTDTPLRQTPASIDSVTEEVLRSRNSTSIQDALRNIPGVVFTQNGASSQAIIRGDTTTGTTFTNGLRNSAQGGIESTIDVEAIEVLKGPASILSGVDVPGGIINYVPKRALGTSPTTIDLGVGSGSEVRASVDTGGAISQSNRLYWRAVGLIQYADHLPNGSDEPHTNLITGILGYRDNGWKVDATLKFASTQIAQPGFDYYRPSTGEFVAARTLNSARFGKTEQVTATYGIERDLVSTDGFTLRLRNRGLFQRGETDYQIQGSFPYYILGNYQITSSSGALRSRQFSELVDLYSKFHTGPLQHQLIIAFDYFHQNGGSLNGGFVGRFVLPTAAPTALPDIPAIGLVKVSGTESFQEQKGAVVQDQINWGRLHLLGALRQTWYTGSSVGYSNGVARTPRVTTGNKLVPNVGGVFDLTGFASVYASYQQSYTPTAPTTLAADGTLLPPVLRIQHEFGLKTAFLNDRFTLNAAYFEYTTDNTALSDPASPLFYITGPGQRAHGAELSMQGELSKTLRLTGGLTYTHARDQSGNRRTGQSDWIGNLWVQKDVRFANGHVLGLAAGGEYQSDPAINTVNFNTYALLPRDYRSLDAAISYTIARSKLNLTVDNLTNRRNYSSPSVSWFLPLAAPRIVRLVFTQQF